jgi:hypothetical protein
MLKPDDEPETYKERPLRLVPLTQEEADAFLHSDGDDARAKENAQHRHFTVKVAKNEVPVSLDKLMYSDLVLGGHKANATHIHDTYLSHEQLRLSRRSVAPGAEDDLTGTGIALDVTHCGKNMSYLIPVGSVKGGVRDKRFSEHERAQHLLPNGVVTDDRLVALHPGVMRAVCCVIALISGARRWFNAQFAYG